MVSSSIYLQIHVTSLEEAKLGISTPHQSINTYNQRVISVNANSKQNTLETIHLSINVNNAWLTFNHVQTFEDIESLYWPK